MATGFTRTGLPRAPSYEPEHPDLQQLYRNLYYHGPVPATPPDVRDGELWVDAGGNLMGRVSGADVVYGTPTGSADAATLNGQDGTYYLSRANHTGTQGVATIDPAGAAGRFMQTRSVRGALVNQHSSYGLPATGGNGAGDVLKSAGSASDAQWARISYGDVDGQIPASAMMDFVANVAGYTWEGAQLFSAVAAFNGTAQPFTVVSTGRVDNLNADLLDGQDGAYYSNAANLTGALSDDRLSALIPRLNVAAAYTAGVLAERTTAAGLAWRSRINTDANYRFEIAAAGTHRWGDGVTGTTNIVYYVSNLVQRTNSKWIFDLEVEIDGTLNHDGATVGLYGVTPVARAAAIAAPSAGATVDTEARTAINAIRTALTNIGITS